VHSWQRLVLGAALVALIACAGIAANFALLRMTQEARDPVGKLGPRAVFTPESGSPTIPSPSAGATTDTDDSASGHDGDD
jgi:hypothetical protein